MIVPGVLRPGIGKRTELTLVGHWPEPFKRETLNRRGGRKVGHLLSRYHDERREHDLLLELVAEPVDEPAEATEGSPNP